MKNLKKYLAVITMVGMLGTAGAAFAASPATTSSTELNEFKAKRLEEKKIILEQRVQEGRLTRAQADEAYNAIKNNQASCDGTGSAKIGQKYNAGFGKGSGKASGKGVGQKQGQGKKMGQGKCQGGCTK